MSLADRITADLKTAMKNKDDKTLRGVRAVKQALILAQTESGRSKEITEDQEVQMLQKLVKQRKDSIAIFKEQGRDDLAAKEEEEVEVIQRYLPEQMSQEKLDEEIKSIIAEVGAESTKDMGKVMGAATKKLAGKADNKAIADTVKAQLNN